MASSKKPKSHTVRMTERYGMTVSSAMIRTVWAAVTRSPNLSTHELADQLGISFSSVSVAIRVLHDAEYIDAPKRWSRAKAVLLGFYKIEGNPHEKVV